MKRDYKPIALLDTAGLTEADWLEARDHGDGSVKWGIGGSDVATIFNLSPWKSPMELYDAKKGIAHAVPIKKNEAALKRGHDFEEYVAQAFASKMEKDGHKVEITNDTRLFQHGEYLLDEYGDFICDENGDPILKYPFALANLDRIAKVDGSICILECKTTSPHNFDTIKDWKNGLVPIYYEYQCRYYMAIMNLDVCYICCLWGLDYDNDCSIVKIERDEAIEEIIMEEVAHFVDGLENNNPPSDADSKESLAVTYYNSLYGESDARLPEIELPEDFIEIVQDIKVLDERIEEFKRRIESLEEKKKKYEVEFAKVMKTAEKARVYLPDNKVAYIKYKTGRKVSKLDTDRIKTEMPAAYAECLDFSSTIFRDKYKKEVKNFTLPAEGKTDKKLEIKFDIVKGA